MPINVTCPGCLARFTVSEKFAGKQGACPKCKGVIKVPALSEQVVIHEAEHEAGAKDSTGRSVLKPIEREEAKFNPLLAILFGGLAIVAPLVAWMMRGTEHPIWVLSIGAVVLAPPLCWGGYSFLRNQEMGAYEGTSLWIRTIICSLVYAGLWGAHFFIARLFYGSQAPEPWHIGVTAPIFGAAGASVAYLCYDLDFGNGFFHYALYLVATIALRLVMGLNPVYQPQASSDDLVRWASPPAAVAAGEVSQLSGLLLSAFDATAHSGFSPLAGVYLLDGDTPLAVEPSVWRDQESTTLQSGAYCCDHQLYRVAASGLLRRAVV